MKSIPSPPPSMGVVSTTHSSQRKSDTLQRLVAGGVSCTISTGILNPNDLVKGLIDIFELLFFSPSAHLSALSRGFEFHVNLI